MKDEIKEILDMLKQHISIISVEDEDLLLDYITNLQDRTKELETINEEHRRINGKLREENEKLLKKSYSDDVRITKVIEEIKKRSTKEVADLYINLLQGSDE